MDIQVNAIYENGVLKPLEPVALGEREQVQLVITPSSKPSVSPNLAESTRQRRAIDEMLAEFDRLPQPKNGDKFCGADHDAVLYGRSV